MNEIKAEEIKLVPLEKIIENPKNANRHSIEQIERLVDLINFQGFRNPLIISKRTGLLVAGHGRKIAAEKIGFKNLPCVYQEFENEEQEYAYLISDNEIARWAQLDFQSVYDEMKVLDIPDIDLLGIENFVAPDISEMEDDDDNDSSENEPKKYVIEVQFPNDMEMMEAHDEMASQGYMVKIK